MTQINSIIDIKPNETATHASASDAKLAVAHWLSGTRVLSVGSSLVVRVASDALRTFGASVDTASPSVVQDHLACREYDVVLVDRIGATPQLWVAADRSAADYLEQVASRNRAVWITASAFGLQTGRADAKGSELTVLASAGILGHSHSEGVESPTVPAGDIGLKLVGTVMATSALHGLHAFRQDHKPVHVDLSAQAAVISTGLCLETAHALGRCPDQGGSSRYGAPTGFFDCADGRFYIVVLEQHQWAALRSCLAPALEDIPTIEDARQRRDAVNTAVAAWAASRSAVECECRLQEAGVPCTAINTVGAFFSRAARAGRPLDANPGEFSLPAMVTQRVADVAIEQAKAIPLLDLQILDAGHVLAVPLAAAWLGAMGARVTKLEDPERLDVYRRRGPYVNSVNSLNSGAYFNQINFCKTPLRLEVGSPRSSLDVTKYDVVLHNLTPRRARAVGVDSTSVLTPPGTRLALCSSGFGSTGEWAEYRAYGHNIHAFSGLVAATRDAVGRVDDVGTPWSDPLTSVIIAAWVLAWSLADHHGRSTSVDLSMAEIMAAQITDLQGVVPEDYYLNPAVGGDFFLRAGDGEGTVALSLAGAADVERLERITRVPFVALRTRGSMLPTSNLGKLAAMKLDDLERTLRDHGLAAVAVRNARELADDAFVRSTGLYQSVESTALGTYDVTGLPWVFVGRAREAVTAAPEI